MQPQLRMHRQHTTLKPARAPSQLSTTESWLASHDTVCCSSTINTANAMHSEARVKPGASVHIMDLLGIKACS
eukprot:m.280287 g.280287  ORF g.280287 m.280287 type:complete len:73 (-) comp15748_c1_seq20:843-1061(-)